ncbi:MAG: trxA [Deltaproteobacteria bacterium]|jgi:thioredoxin 1|nr:trxA [Deltaproteobacteria bacterium]
MTLEITDSSFQTEVTDSALPVLVDFWAPWCGPCKMVAPVLEELAQEYAGKLKIVKLNVDQNQQVAAQFGISSIPTLIMFKNGKESGKMIGFQSKDALKKMIAGSL